MEFVDPLWDGLLPLWDTSQQIHAGHLIVLWAEKPYALRFYQYTANCGPAGCGVERLACCANAITLFL